MKPLKIVLADLCYFNYYDKNRLFVPLSIGYIASYLRNYFNKEIKLSLFKNAEQLLSYIKTNKPDIVGLSLYYWNTELNYYVVKKTRQLYENNVIIGYGGPSIDIDINEQQQFFLNFPEIDFIIPNEGEIGFYNLIKRIINSNSIWDYPIEGVIFKEKKRNLEVSLIRGKDIEFSLNLDELNSPYLLGILDDFLKEDFQPLIQTSRLCPYQCSYCVSGKNKGKLKFFPIEIVKEEIKFIAKKYQDRPYSTLHLCDDNFGIFERDIEIADFLSQCSNELGYPKKIEFYSVKKFSERSKKIIKKLGKFNFLGLPISLQSINEKTLKAIHRKNLSDNEIISIIKWASSENILTGTELIFGLPHETKETFLFLLEKCIELGFDLIQCYNLILVDGSELNRLEERRKYNIKTKFRLPSSYYDFIDGNFIAEAEELVVQSDSFSFDDFIDIRCINFMFHTVFSLNFYKLFFHYIRSLGIRVVDFFNRFMNPDDKINWSKEYIIFIKELKELYILELSNSKEELKNIVYNKYIKDNKLIRTGFRINLFFASRLMYLDIFWVKNVFEQHLINLLNEKKINIKNELNNINCIMDICDKEIIKFPNIKKPENIKINYDILKWRNMKFQNKLCDFKMLNKNIEFCIDLNVQDKLYEFHNKYHSLYEEDIKNYYYFVMDFIFPRDKLFYTLKYV